MVKVREIPTEAEAVQFKGANIRELISFGGDAIQFAYGDNGIEVSIDAQDGKSVLEMDDWVIKYDDGRMTACSKDLFAVRFETV